MINSFKYFWDAKSQPLFDLIKQKQTTASYTCVIYYMFPECDCHFECRAAFLFVCLLVFLSLSFVYDLIFFICSLSGIKYENSSTKAPGLKPLHL